MTDFLMDTETLAACLDDEAIRIFDCTTLLLPDPNGTYRVESGKAAFEEAHIPGAAFLDLQGDFSTQQSRLRFTLPTDEDFSRSATAHGISNDSHLVFYSTTAPMWATRLCGCSAPLVMNASLYWMADWQNGSGKIGWSRRVLLRDMR